MRDILIAIFLWSSLGIIIRTSGVPVQHLIFFSCAISTVLIGGYFFRKTSRAVLPRGRSLISLCIIGPLSLLNSYTFFYAYQNTSVANAVLTHYTAPVLVAFLSPFFLGEKLTFRILSSVSLATAGLWIMLGNPDGDSLGLFGGSNTHTRGIIAGLISGVAYAVLIMLFRAFTQVHHPLVMTFLQNSVIAVLLSPVIIAGSWHGEGLWAFVVVGIVHSTIAPVLYFRGVKRVSANRTAILGYLEPVCAILLGMVFLHEPVGLRTVIGGTLVIISGCLTLGSRKDL